MVQLQRGGEKAKDTTSSLPPPDTLAGLLYGYEPSCDEMEEITHQGERRRDSWGEMARPREGETSFIHLHCNMLFPAWCLSTAIPHYMPPDFAVEEKLAPGVPPGPSSARTLDGRTRLFVLDFICKTGWCSICFSSCLHCCLTMQLTFACAGWSFSHLVLNRKDGQGVGAGSLLSRVHGWGVGHPECAGTWQWMW